MILIILSTYNELDEQKRMILKNGEKVTEQVTQNIDSILDEKFKSWEEKYENLKDKLDSQEKRLYFLEKQSRQRNIILFGLEETESSYSNLENTLTSFINKYLNVKLDQRDIQEARRIGKKEDRPRPIKITIINILKQKKELKNTTYYIKEDYPEHILKKRKELQEQVNIEKEKGNSVIIVYDKLKILNKNPNSPTKHKRMLSSSPESGQKNEPNTQFNKKNKTRSNLHRSSSLAEGPVKPGLLNFFSGKNSNYPSKKLENTNNVL